MSGEAMPEARYSMSVSVGQRQPVIIRSDSFGSVPIFRAWTELHHTGPAYSAREGFRICTPFVGGQLSPEVVASSDFGRNFQAVLLECNVSSSICNVRSLEYPSIFIVKILILVNS